MNGSSLIQSLFDQIDNIWVVLERPVVQYQLIAFALVGLIAWGLGRLAESRADRLGALLGRAFGRQLSLRWQTWLVRWSEALADTLFPLLGLLLGTLSIRLFRSLGWHAGLLDQIQGLFWLLLAYRFLGTVFFAVLNEERAAPYQHRLLRPLFWVTAVLILNRVLLGIASPTELAVRLFGRDFTVGSLFGAAVIFYLFLLGSWVVEDLMEHAVLPRFSADPGITNTILTVGRYLIVSLGLLTALGTLGIDLSSLAIIGAGLSVGIGFGLQDLVANFISGILLLFEQSIRPGDVVKISENVGTVQKLRIRSTTIRTFDNIEIIVPNQSLLTSAVTTYTHNDRSVRMRVPVGASYDADPIVVREALMAAAARHELVKKFPPPVVFFDDFGDSSINFELAVWLEDLEFMRQVRSDLRFLIWEEFKAREIEIPYPQRDLHLRSGVPWESLLSSGPTKLPGRPPQAELP